MKKSLFFAVLLLAAASLFAQSGPFLTREDMDTFLANYDSISDVMDGVHAKEGDAIQRFNESADAFSEYLMTYLGGGCDFKEVKQSYRKIFTIKTPPDFQKAFTDNGIKSDGFALIMTSGAYLMIKMLDEELEADDFSDSLDAETDQDLIAEIRKVRERVEMVHTLIDPSDWAILEAIGADKFKEL